MHDLTLILGDANGPELATAMKAVLEAAGVPIRWDEHALTDGTLSEAGYASLRSRKLGLMGWQSGYREVNAAPPIVRIREKLGMFANVRPIRSMLGLVTRHHEIDILLVRETTEDVYAHLEHESIPGVYESLKVTTRAACERIARHAFETAVAAGRKKVTIVHKANIMKRSDGLFLKVAREVGAKYPQIHTEDVIVDALCMKLVLAPQKFDVLVAGNLYGDILADLCAGLVGGGSNSPSINVGPDVVLVAAAHGDAPAERVAGRGNLVGLLIPATELLRRVGEAPAADRIWKACEKVLIEGRFPPGLGGDLGPERFANAVIERL
jgi:isocitrate dehydrogenase (NAD+)